MENSWGRWGRNSLEKTTANFLKRVTKNESGCWLWGGAIGSHKRYGIISIAGKQMLAHRASWELFRGSIGKLFVLHRCDNGFCVNPDHLFLGTQKDNILDMEGKSRSRHPKQEEHGRAKLTFAIVEQAKERKAKGELIKDLAFEFGVDRHTMSNAIRGNTWVTK